VNLPWSTRAASPGGGRPASGERRSLASAFPRIVVDVVRPRCYRSKIKDLQVTPFALSIASVEDAVYSALRTEIGRLRLAPEERLRLEDLAGRFQVSLTPIRHALRRLEAEGLVVSVPRRGSRVAPLSVEELEEIQAIRLGLESFLARRGAERCSDGALAEMAARRVEMEDSYRRGDLDAYLGSFWSFRDACYRCAGRPRLERALGDQRFRAERYVLYLCRDVEAAAQLRHHPDRLLEACRRRDGEAAEAATRAALLWVLDRLTAMLGDAERARADLAS
jgi:DNA-binding GntR family transcriptional regulator